MTTLVLGVGVSGLAAARLALSAGHTVSFYDERIDAAVPPDLHPVSVATGVWSPDLLSGVDLVITSPGFPPSSRPLRDAAVEGIRVVTEIGFALDQVDTPYIAVTGTNGKTTVTELVTLMLTESGIDALAIGNIGTPAADIVGSAHDVLVVELSSFQLHWWTPRPVAAGLVNIAPDHLDWHGGFAEYTLAKAKVFAALDPGGVVAYDADDAVAAGVVEGSTMDVTKVPCSGHRLPNGGCGVDGNELVIGGGRYSIDSSDSSFRLDVVIAATLALSAGATHTGIASAIGRFVPGNHRRRVVAEIDGATWVNDSKATNPHASAAACAAYPSVRLLAGGRNKALDLSPLARIPNVVHIYAFGESGAEIAAAADGRATSHTSMLDAIAAARADAQPGDTVLLSPGCTSFDEFSSYAERGRVFEDTVRAMDGGDDR